MTYRLLILIFFCIPKNSHCQTYTRKPKQTAQEFSRQFLPDSFAFCHKVIEYNFGDIKYGKNIIAFYKWAFSKKLFDLTTLDEEHVRKISRPIDADPFAHTRASLSQSATSMLTPLNRANSGMSVHLINSNREWPLLKNELGPLPSEAIENYDARLSRDRLGMRARGRRERRGSRAAAAHCRQTSCQSLTGPRPGSSERPFAGR